MKRLIMTTTLLVGIIFGSQTAISQQYIADFTVAKEEVLRSIPEAFINLARTELVIAYQHTSHGTHVSRGVFGLPDYKDGDDVLFGVSTTSEAGKLEFRDYALASYAPAGIDASDLSRDETAFIQTTRNYLDAPENASVNVVMWSWCNIAGHDAEGNYLPGMDSLIAEYGEGGTKIGSGAGQREKAVTFIFMTGHANTNANVGTLNPKGQSALITDNCNMHGYFCLDYYTIDTYDMDDNYWEDAGDNGNSSAYGGNYYEDWENSQVLGVDYYYNKAEPGGSVSAGSHNTQHITANRKGYAMWWILARIAGWNGYPSSVEIPAESEPLVVYPNPGTGMFYINSGDSGIDEIQVFRIDGTKVYAASLFMSGSTSSVDLSDLPPGIYGIALLKNTQVIKFSKIILTSNN